MWVAICYSYYSLIAYTTSHYIHKTKIAHLEYSMNEAYLTNVQKNVYKKNVARAVKYQVIATTILKVLVHSC